MAQDLNLKVILGFSEKVSKPLKQITGNSAKLSKEFKETRDQLKQLQNQQKNVTAFRKANAELRSQSRSVRDLQIKSQALTDALNKQGEANVNIKANLKAARSQYNKLSTAMLEGKASGEEFNRELEKSKIRLMSMQQASDRSSREIKKYQQQIKATDTRIKELTGRHEVSKEKLGRYKQQLNEAGINTTKLGAKSRTLRSQEERLTDTFQKQEQALRKLGQRQKHIADLRAKHAKNMGHTGMVAATGVGMAAAGRSAGTGIANLLKPGIAFGKQMSELQAVSRLGKADPLFQQLKQQAQELGATTQFKGSDVAAGQTFLARAGFSPKAIQAAMPDMLAMALANNTDLARSADIASNIAGVFKIDPEIQGNMTRVADVLSGTAARANVDLEMLGDTMKYLGGVKDLNLSLEQAAAMAGILGNIGIQGTQAGTTMRAMMNRLTAPAKLGRDAMKEIGLAVNDAQGNMRSMPDILRDIADGTKSMGNSDRKRILQNIFGAEAGSGMAELVSKMADGGMGKILKELKNVQGENQRMADVMSDNAAGDLASLSSAWEDIGTTLTETNNGPIRSTIQMVTDLLRGISSWIKAHPVLAGGLLKTAAALAMIATVLGTLTVGFASIAAPILISKFLLTRLGLSSLVTAGSMSTLFGVLKAISLFLLANPIVAALALLAAAGVMLYKNWDGVIGGLKALWQNLAEYISNMPIVGAVLRFFSGDNDAPALATAGAGDVSGGNSRALIRAKNIRTDKRPPFTARGSGAVVQGDTISININSAPGMDDEATARVVRKEMERHSRNKRARANSAMYDQD